MYKRFLKPLADVFFAFGGLILCAPFFLVLIPALCIVNRGSAFYYAERTGHKGRAFTMVKFQTLVPRNNSNDVRDERERLTGLGRILRWTSLDELPQLWNVLKGDMSFVGPRPLPVS